jgi:hypothetical protein
MAEPNQWCSAAQYLVVETVKQELFIRSEFVRQEGLQLSVPELAKVQPEERAVE